MHTLLLVDDEPFNLELMSELLEEAGYHTEQAESGEEAWQKLSQHGDRYGAVLLDKMMPGINGFEVLRRIKQESELGFLPVILQTAVGTPASIQEGLEAGAFYYLTKPFTRDMLLAVVSAAVKHWDRHQQFRQLAGQQLEALSQLQHARFTLHTQAEAQSLTNLLASLAGILGCQPGKLATGLFELLINAIEHGNLELSSADKGRLQSAGEWETELARRQSNPLYQPRTVSLEFERSEHELAFTIRDQGPGFDPAPFLDDVQAMHTEGHGRGILIARKLSFNSVEYLDGGRCVRAALRY